MRERRDVEAVGNEEFQQDMKKVLGKASVIKICADI